MVPALAPQTRFHNGSPTRRLEKIQERQHFIVHRQRQIVSGIFRRFLGALLQTWIYRKGHLCHFIDRRRHRGRFLKAVPCAEGLQLVGVNGVDHPVKQFAQSWITLQVVAAFQHGIDGIVELFARGLQMAGLEVSLAGSESRLHSGNHFIFSRG